MKQISPIPAAWAGLLSRRDVLRVGSLAVAAAASPGVSAARADAPRGTRPPTARSVILLWMSGGVTHLDSFDPKPDAPSEVRGTLGAIQTTIPGVQFNESIPSLARHAQQLAVVRTFAHDSNDHFIGQAHCLSGRHVTAQQTFSEPNIGAIASMRLGPRNGFPGYIAAPGTTRAGAETPFTGGWLGREHDPFCTGGLQPLKLAEEDVNMQGLKYADELSSDRLSRRRSLRQRLDACAERFGEQGPAEILSRQYGAAFDLMLSPEVRQAFDLRLESDASRNEYGRTKIGQRCLLARRLVEAGARFVLVDYGVDVDSGNTWDNHNAPGQNHPPICDIVKEPYHLAGADRAFAALLDDLQRRGRLEETLVVFLTEFGRTPRINKDGGRDHWCWAGSIFFAGGGTRGGQIIGATDAQGAYPLGPSQSPGDVAATIYEALGVDAQTPLHDGQGRPLPVVPEGAAISGILG
jgi:hypothetical protein